MSKATKHKSKQRNTGTGKIKPNAAPYILFVAALVVFSIFALLICTGTWTPW